MRHRSITPVVVAIAAVGAGAAIVGFGAQGEQDAAAATPRPATQQQFAITQRISVAGVKRANANKAAIDGLALAQASASSAPRGVDRSKVTRLAGPDVRVERTRRVEVRCPDGHIALGGGHRQLTGSPTRLNVPVSLPGGGLSSWVIRFHHVQTPNERSVRVRAFAVCVAA